MSPTTCLQLLARLPVAGKVKTRLIPVLGEQGACALHAQLLEDRLALLQACRDELGLAVEWWVDTDAPHPLLARSPGPVCLQHGADLGARMQHALTTALDSNGFRQVLLIGSDCLALDQHYIAQALGKLEEGAEVVLGPALDGGYVLIGLATQDPQAVASLFQDIDWGTDAVLEQTLCRIRDAGLSCSLLPPLPDVDRPEDLQYVPGPYDLTQQ